MNQKQLTFLLNAFFIIASIIILSFNFNMFNSIVLNMSLIMFFILILLLYLLVGLVVYLFLLILYYYYQELGENKNV